MVNSNTKSRFLIISSNLLCTLLVRLCKRVCTFFTPGRLALVGIMNYHHFDSSDRDVSVTVWVHLYRWSCCELRVHCNHWFITPDCVSRLARDTTHLLGLWKHSSYIFTRIAQSRVIDSGVPTRHLCARVHVFIFKFCLIIRFCFGILIVILVLFVKY